MDTSGLSRQSIDNLLLVLRRNGFMKNYYSQLFIYQMLEMPFPHMAAERQGITLDYPSGRVPSMLLEMMWRGWLEGK